MKINGNEIRPGNIIEYKNDLYFAVKTQAVKPGKGGAFAQVELKSLTTGTKLNERFRANETVERVRLEQRDHTFLYAEGNILIFMNVENFDQIELQTEFVGDRAKFLQDGMLVVVDFYEEKAISIKLPDQVTLRVADTEPVIKGQTSANSFKPATLDNGVRFTLKPFFKLDEMIVVDTNELIYLRRADK